MNNDYFIIKQNSDGKRCLVGLTDLGKKQEKIVIPNGIKIIWAGAFKGFYKNEKLNIPKLKHITIPSSVTSIAYEAFQDCKNLENVIFKPNSHLKNIGANAFCRCINLKHITIPKSVKIIEQYAFGDCISLEFIALPNNVEKIEWYAFRDCSSLKSIELSKNIKEIYPGAFSSCTALEKVTFEKGSQLKYIDEGTFFNCAFKHITIPSSVTSICKDAFFHCLHLKSVSFEKGSQLKEIGDSAFMDCHSLQSITIPKSVEIITKATFYDCNNLHSVTFEKDSQLRFIGYSTFRRTLLHEITLPSKLIKIDYSAFIECKYLEEIEMPFKVKIGDEEWQIADSERGIDNEHLRSDLVINENISFFKPSENSKTSETLIKLKKITKKN